MSRWLARAGAAALGITAAALFVNALDLRPRSPELGSQLRRSHEPDAAEPEPGALPAQGPARALPAPFAAPEPKAEDPLHSYLASEAEQLPERFFGEGSGLALADLRDQIRLATDVVYESPDRQRWITSTAVRVDCAEVDRLLRRQDDPSFGRPDRCARWHQEASELMHRHQLPAMDPAEFLEQIGAEPTARVMLLYAGWHRDPEAEDSVRLLAAQPVHVYPHEGFAERDFRARDQLNRALKLGPYAEDGALAQAD